MAVLHPHPPFGDLTYYPTFRWIRGTRGKDTIVDSRRAVLVWEPGTKVPIYAFPREDVALVSGSAAPSVSQARGSGPPGRSAHQQNPARPRPDAPTQAPEIAGPRQRHVRHRSGPAIRSGQHSFGPGQQLSEHAGVGAAGDDLPGGPQPGPGIVDVPAARSDPGPGLAQPRSSPRDGKILAARARISP